MGTIAAPPQPHRRTLRLAITALPNPNRSVIPRMPQSLLFLFENVA